MPKPLVRIYTDYKSPYAFVANMVRNTAGHDGMKFFPLVASLFLFVLVAKQFITGPG